MGKHTERQIAFAVLLLVLAAVGSWHWHPSIAALQERQSYRLFLPLVEATPEPSAVDLRILHLGVYQSVQDGSNNVPLVAGKPTLLRVYGQVVGSAQPVHTEVTVVARRDGVKLGQVSLGPRRVAEAPSADDIESTFNIYLPAAWLSGGVELTASIDPAGNYHESSETNNAAQLAVTFHNVPDLDLTIVPVEYTDTVTGVTFDAHYVDPISHWLRSAYPVGRVQVSFHTPYAFSGNLRLGSEWERLLNELTTLWSAEVGPAAPNVYYGLIPTEGLLGQEWFEGGVSGLGWIGQRVAIGLNLGLASGPLAGHELGHNFGRLHAPCGNPGDVDPHYPYPEASIGVHGSNLQDEVFWNPEDAHDMMSYCGPEWISDYTYRGLMQEQQMRGRNDGREIERAVLFRATVEDSGQVTILPAYEFEHPVPDPAMAAQTAGYDDASEYVVELVDGQGKVTSTQQAYYLEAHERGVEAEMLLAGIPSAGDVAEIRVRRGSEIVARQFWLRPDERLQGAGQKLLADALENGALELRWDASGPGLIRHSTDGLTWTTLGIDVPGGRFTIDPELLAELRGILQVVPAGGAPPLTLQID